MVDHGSPPGGSEFFSVPLIEFTFYLEYQDKLANSIGYHIAAGFIVKVPSWVNFFILSTHPQESELATLPPRNLLVDTAYMDDPSSIFAAYKADWWNNPGSALTIPAAYSEEETAAFGDWLKLANQVRVNYRNSTGAHHM